VITIKEKIKDTWKCSLCPTLVFDSEEKCVIHMKLIHSLKMTKLGDKYNVSIDVGQYITRFGK